MTQGAKRWFIRAILLIGFVLLVIPESAARAHGLEIDWLRSSGVVLIGAGFLWYYIADYHGGQRAIEHHTASRAANKRLTRAGLVAILSLISFVILARLFFTPGNPLIFTLLLPTVTLIWALADATFAVFRHWNVTHR